MAYTAPTALLPRQVNVIIGSNPSATISSLSSALVTASSNIATLSQQSQQLSQQSQQLSQSLQQLSQSTQVLSQSVQQLQIRSAQDVQNIRNSAAFAMASMASSANAAIATASNNAAVALASISGSLAAVASAARQSALAEQENASSVRAQAQTQVMTAQGNAISVTQTTIAIVASIAGTFILSLVGFLFFLRSRNRQQRRRIAELKGTIKRPVSPTGSSNMVWDNKGWHQRSEKEHQQQERSTEQSPEPQPMIGVATSSQFGREKRSSNWPLSSSVMGDTQKTNRQTMDPSNITIVKVGQAEGGAGDNAPSQQQSMGAGSTKAPNLSLFPKITEPESKKDPPTQGGEGSDAKQANGNTPYPPRYSVEPERGTTGVNKM